MNHILCWLLYIATAWCLGPRVSSCDSVWFSALQCVPPAPEVLAEIKKILQIFLLPHSPI